MDHLLDSQLQHYGHRVSSCQREVLDVLNNASDFLKDESLTAVTAIQACTEKVVENLNAFHRRYSYHVGARDSRGTRSVPDEGFTPQLFKYACALYAVE